VRTWRAARALVILTCSTARRLLREGLVVRSLVWPTIVASGTLALTLLVMIWLRPPWLEVAVTPDMDPALRSILVQRGFKPVDSDNPAALVESRTIDLGTDGHTVWIVDGHPHGSTFESTVRKFHDAPWAPVRGQPISTPEGAVFGRTVCRFLALVFTLYGLVFGLGGVARDRDDGTLEAELALPVPRVVVGLSRWLASTLVLGPAYALAVAVFAALLTVADPVSVLLHGTAASATAAAIGIAVVGTAGIRQGFAGPFAMGMTLATGLAGAGAALDLDWVPIASLFAGGSGWESAGLAVVAGVAASIVFAQRAGRT
jgi:hypothetical protein